MSFGDPWFYIVLLGIAALIYAMLLPNRKSPEKLADHELGNIEVTLEQYMSEIERENDELIDLVAQMKQDFTSKQLAHQEQIVELRQRIVEVEQASRHVLNNTIPVVESTNIGAVAPSASPSVSVEKAGSPAPVFEDTQAAVLIEEVTDNSEVMETKASESVRDRYPELFDLYEKGKSIDMIAKTIGMQRGEIQLVLQLAKREEI